MIRTKKDLSQLIDALRSDPEMKNVIKHWHTIPEKLAQTVPLPEGIDHRLRKALQKRGISQLYTHQAEALKWAEKSESFVVVTPTASGKTLCYNLPVLEKISQNKECRALYLFPTKALARDQMHELHRRIEDANLPVNTFTYDGDTPQAIRQKVRKAGNIVISNPDMLHSGILPHHTKWISFFEHLQVVVIDELHTYRGVFGSHVANVIRRLKRICRFYGSHPIFICTSATIANPRETAERLTGERMRLITRNGAPQGKKHLLLCQPPVVRPSFHIRESAQSLALKVAQKLISNRIQTIVFARSRLAVEIMLSDLQNSLHTKTFTRQIRGYRGGYLPGERREIEKGLRTGEITGVVSTNALEVGIDIGGLSACVITGYPGTVSSFWQQAGRAGRKRGESLVIYVAGANPLEEYFIQHPELLLEGTPESARLDPDNIMILVDHLKCAAYELPFAREETFDGIEVEEILDYLTEKQLLHLKGEKWFWMNEAFPAHNVSLRSASQENVVIIDQTHRSQPKVIGEADRFSALTLLHDKAIYMHEAEQYEVERLDLSERKAYVRQVNVNYYTDAELAVRLNVLEEDREKSGKNIKFCYGDIAVHAMATIYKKIRFETYENIGWGPIQLPEEELHTTGTWLQLSTEAAHSYSEDELEKGLTGLAYVLRHLAPLYVMCDRGDLHVTPQVKAVHSEKPTIFLYDRYPGGIGLSEKIFNVFPEMLKQARQLIRTCSCKNGCPSCVGVTDAPQRKAAALSLLQLITGK